jgi:hypothetical protein
MLIDLVIRRSVLGLLIVVLGARATPGTPVRSVGAPESIRIHRLVGPAGD